MKRLKYLMGSSDESRYRLVGITVFAAWCAMILVRIAMRWVTTDSELAADAAFTIPVQVGLLLLFPFLMYRFGLKMSTREVLAFSNVRKCKWQVLLLSVPLGFCVFFATIGVSTLWQTFISLLGYTHASSSSDLPAQFDFWMFLASLVLTAVLPAVCEEFSVRGGLLTVFTKTFRPELAIVLMGVAFGLFHQNITQVFYTTVFGMLMAYLAYKHKSLLPCVIIHFINNGTSVYLEYAEAYNWWGGNFFDWLNARLASNGMLVLTLYALICGVGFLIVVLMQRYAEKPVRPENRPAPPDVPKFNVNPFADIGIDPFAPSGPVRRIDPFAPSEQRIDPFAPTAEPAPPVNAPPQGATVVSTSAGDKAAAALPVNGLPDGPPKEKRFRPRLKDNAFFIGAVVLSVLTTIFSFIWGLFY